MSRKLSDAEKQAIVDLYRQPETSTSVLAERFEVSASTIGRILKTGIPADEYGRLVQQKKRLSRGSLRADLPASGQLDLPTSDSVEVTPVGPPPTAADSVETSPSTTVSPSASPALADRPEASGTRRRRRRSATRTSGSAAAESTATESVTDETAGAAIAPPQPAAEIETETEVATDTTDTDTTDTDSTATTAAEPSAPAKPRPILAKDRRVLTEPAAEPAAEPAETKTAEPAAATTAGTADETDIDSEDDFELPEIFGDYDRDGDSDDEDDADEDWDSDDDASQTTFVDGVQVLPFAQASFPKTCYLAIDKVSEPIVKPLSDFSELGSVPEAEAKQPTLAIFDNHRVARRFAASRFQRVLKIPDGNLLHKTRPYLAAKGITRVLVDGRVYSLAPEDD